MGEPRGRDARWGEPNSKGHVTRDPSLCRPENDTDGAGRWGAAGAGAGIARGQFSWVS